MVSVSEIRQAGFEIPDDVVNILRDVNKAEGENTNEMIGELAVLIRGLAVDMGDEKLMRQLVDVNVLTMRMIVARGGDPNDLLQKGIARVARATR